MTNNIDHTLLANYFASECTEAESAAVEAWARASLEHAKVLEECRALWQAVPRQRSRWNVDDALGAVREAIEASPRLTLTTADPLATRSPAHGGRRGPVRWRVGVASVAVLVIGVSAVVFARRDQPERARADLAPWREISTTKGQRTSFQLADGTRVSLAVNSRLRFAPAFDVASRDIYLEGEAFFEVTHDPRKPFLVHSANAVTKVLGTKFGVRAYAGDADVRVVVLEGRVHLRPLHADSGQGALLTSNQLGRLGTTGDVDVRSNVDVESQLQWIDGRIRFSDASLREVVRELEHWYYVEFAIADPSLDSLQISVTFEHESLDDVVHIIARTLGLHAERHGPNIVFSRNVRSQP